jgi:hypothetical protein
MTQIPTGCRDVELLRLYTIMGKTNYLSLRYIRVNEIEEDFGNVVLLLIQIRRILLLKLILLKKTGYNFYLIFLSHTGKC